MPAYRQSSAALPITAIRRHDLPVAVWSAENPLTGTKSQALNLGPSQPDSGSGGQFVRISGKFAAAPGAFTIQIETADEDVDTSYVAENFGGGTPGQATTANANNAFSIELMPIVAKFIRASSVLQNANGVNLTLTISRG